VAHHAWDVGGAACADKDEVDPGEQGAVERCGQREFDLAQEVDSDEPVVSLLGEEHLREACGDRQLLQADRGGQGMPRHLGEAPLGTDAALDEVGIEDPAGHLGPGEGRQGSAHVAARVTTLQAAGQQDVQRGPRDNAELAGHGHGTSEPPVRHRDTHPSLDDDGLTEGGCGGHDRASRSLELTRT